MRLVIFILVIFLPRYLLAQIPIEYSDLIGLPETRTKFKFYKNVFDEFNINLESFFKIKQSSPFPEIEVYYLGEKIFKAEGSILDIRSDTFSIIIKLVRPVCCCLQYKEISVLKYDKKYGTFHEDEFVIHKDLLMPISDVVFEFKRVDSTLTDLTLYCGPYASSFKEYDECTGEVLDGSIIGVYKISDFYYLVYKTSLWELIYIPVDSKMERKSTWVLGWRYIGK